MFVFFGDCEKHDFVIPFAAALGALLKTEPHIVSDDDRNYKYFNGSVSGVTISSHSKTREGLTIYDCHKVIIPDFSQEKLVLFTDMSRPSLDMIRSVQSRLSTEAIIVIEEESSISRKYIETYVRDDVPIYSYPRNSRRLFDFVYDGKINFKNLDSNFLKVVNKVLVEQAGMSGKDLKSLWAYLKRRG